MKYLSIFALLLFTFSINAQDSAVEKTAKMTPEVKEIVEKSKIALKMDKLADVKTMEQSANLSIANMNINGKIDIKLAENGILVISKVASLTEKQGYNGKTAWSESLTTGLRTLKGSEKLKLVAETMKYAFNPEKFYDEIKLAGKEEFNGKQCFKLELIKKGMDSSFEYIDIESYLTIGTKDTIETPQGKMKATTKILSYKEHEKGFKYADKVSQSMGPMVLKISITKMKVNTEFDSKVFNPPAQ